MPEPAVGLEGGAADGASHTEDASEHLEPAPATRAVEPLTASAGDCGVVTPNLYARRQFRQGNQWVDSRSQEVALSPNGQPVSEAISAHAVEARYSASCAVRAETATSLVFDVGFTGHARRICDTGPAGSNGRVAPVWRGRLVLPGTATYGITTAYTVARSASDGRALGPPSGCVLRVGTEQYIVQSSSGTADSTVAAGTVLLEITCAQDANDGLAATGCYGAPPNPDPRLVSPEQIDGTLSVRFTVQYRP